jgi:RNA polymerase sigma factor (sigma-70 family)
MEVSALTYSGGIGLHGRSRLLRLQSDERLVALLRRGNTPAFEVLVARYEPRLLAFCRHLLGSREDAEDVMQEVMTAAFNAMLADDRPINVRPWLYRIARNRSLNHLRRIQAIGVESMDVHFSDGGASTADKVHEREEFRLLVGDIHDLPETQKTAVVLREMEALSYEQIAEAMETTVSSVKSLLVRARVSLAEAAEARLLSCDEVRIELAEVAEGLRRRPGPLVRRHLRSCQRCMIFRGQLKQTNKALAALFPIGPALLLKNLLFAHLGHSAGAGSSATAASSGAAGAGAAGAGAAGAGAAGAGATGAAVAGSGALAGSGGLVSAGIGALATKAAAGLAAAALVTGAAVEADHSASHHAHHAPVVASVLPAVTPAVPIPAPPLATHLEPRSATHVSAPPARSPTASQEAVKTDSRAASKSTTTATAASDTSTIATTRPGVTTAPAPRDKTVAGRTQNQSDATVLPALPMPNSTTPPTTSEATVASVPTTTTSTTTTTSDTTAPPTTDPTSSGSGSSGGSTGSGGSGASQGPGAPSGGSDGSGGSGGSGGLGDGPGDGGGSGASASAGSGGPPASSGH